MRLCTRAHLRIFPGRRLKRSVSSARTEWGLPAFFYSADRLNALPGSFTASDFVRKVTGTDNVCERSALCRAGDHAGLILPKTGGNGATAALACMKIFFPL